MLQGFSMHEGGRNVNLARIWGQSVAAAKTALTSPRALKQYLQYILNEGLGQIRGFEVFAQSDLHPTPVTRWRSVGGSRSRQNRCGRIRRRGTAASILS